MELVERGLLGISGENGQGEGRAGPPLRILAGGGVAGYEELRLGIVTGNGARRLCRGRSVRLDMLT
jgi:hypothetical protein